MDESLCSVLMLTVSLSVDDDAGDDAVCVHDVGRGSLTCHLSFIQDLLQFGSFESHCDYTDLHILQN